jgi:hypothetical protein
MLSTFQNTNRHLPAASAMLLAAPLSPPCLCMLPAAGPKQAKAICVATKDEEHAVSMAAEGPWRPNTKLTRPAATLRAEPVI